MTEPVKSVDEFVRWVFGDPPTAAESAFYRGHSKADEYRLQPSVLRNEQGKAAEARNFRELMIANPHAFREDRSTFELLSRMQHNDLPTRLLDTSTNPLVALYFACCSHEKLVGEVVRFTVQQVDVKYYDSDTVSCLANLARLDPSVRKDINTKLAKREFNTTIPVIKLLHFIKEEKPYFRDAIEPGDIDRVLCVKGRHSHERVTAQSGAFLLFGRDAILPEEGNAEIAVRRVRIADGCKEQILHQLDTLAINKGTAFRDLDKQAQYLASRTSPKDPT